MRQVYPFNEWLYRPEYEAGFLQEKDDGGFVPVTLPHANLELPLRYFDEKSYQFVSSYKKHFALPEAFAGKRVFLDFEGVANYAEVYVNGRLAGSHRGGFTPFRLEIGPLLQPGDNTFFVMVDSTERDDIPPFGYLIDFLCYGGMYREASLIVSDEVFIDRVELKAQKVLQAQKELRVTAIVDSPTAKNGVPCHVRLLKEGKEVAFQQANLTLPAGQSRQEVLLSGLTDIALWSLESPELYEVEVSIDGSVYVERTGFRTVAFRPDGFFLNGEKIKLRGLNRHQSYPYVGYAMPARGQKKDADILKEELALNIMRCSHYPQSRHFLDRCDEIGLLVFEELPGWQHIGDEAWKEIACENIREMIRRDYNHPSIAIWGVRINESMNNFEFYEETNRIAHELDDTRPTGGTKYVEGIDFQEDVFVMNDFETGFVERKHRDQRQSTWLDHDVPYLISEFVGIYFPTKRYDPEERRVEQAMRHAWGSDEIALDERISGAIAWCAFDYNTHYEFGPGDRVCYHGVMDMFRLPKYAADFYASQQDAHKKPVLAPATMWSNGDRQNGGFLPLTIFTNCDCVEFHFKGKKTATWYPARYLFGGLAHAPIIVHSVNTDWDNWSWEDARFVGLVDGEPVIERFYAKNPYPAALQASADDTRLQAEGREEAYDATRVVFREVDQAGNLLDFMMEPITFELSGPGKIMGPQDTVLEGGCTAVWVRTIGEKGTIRLQAKTSRFVSNTVEIVVD